MKLLKWLFELVVIAALMFGFAYFIIEALERDEFRQQATAGARYEAMHTPVDTGTGTNYNLPSAPRKHHYQDAGR